MRSQNSGFGLFVHSSTGMLSSDWLAGFHMPMEPCAPKITCQWHCVPHLSHVNRTMCFIITCQSSRIIIFLSGWDCMQVLFLLYNDWFRVQGLFLPCRSVLCDGLLMWQVWLIVTLVVQWIPIGWSEYRVSQPVLGIKPRGLMCW